MYFLILLSCALTLTSAVYPYHYAHHIPLIDHNGVPVDTPEVQAAKALHFSAHAAATHGQYIHPYAGHYGVPLIAHGGHPVDSPEVQLAKAAHFIAYNEAAARNAHHHVTPYVAAAAGPVDTPEVQLAKAAHFAAHQEAQARAGHHYRRRRGLAYNTYAHHIPVIGPNGVPVDTPEVQAAKAAHFAALAKTSTHNALIPHGSNDGHYHQEYNEHNKYYGPLHIPVIGPNGVPVETPEVQAAKADHLAAHNKAGGVYHSGYYNPVGHHSYGNGAPVDTPEVQAARAVHLAAHSAAQGHHYY